ncbi:Nn.00g080460.m01.CDS01 [Neocucurbitaria sp. VM-36]
MDHWGDPWADNNADDKSPTKNEVASPLPPTQAHAPVLLNGFLDDAGWGNEDDGFGEWATSSTRNATDATETPLADSSIVESHGTTSDDAHWDTEELRGPSIATGGDNSSGVASDDPEDIDNVPSETSDSSTTIQPPDAPDSLQPDDSSSTRLSTSPSETSHFGAPVESPRTSVEEDHGAENLPVVDHSVEDDKILEVEGRYEEIRTLSPNLDGETAEDEFGDFSDTTRKEDIPGQLEATPSLGSDAFEELDGATIESEESPEESSRTTATTAVSSNTFPIDLSLLDTLFPSIGATKDLDEAPDDPIYSTTGRKAWYRLTRKQTLREFNSGTADDNHVRVTWANSHVRSEVNKIVGRWAREDRLSGTGPGARASFYWDTPAPVAAKTSISHSRTQSSMPTPRAAAPVRQSLPPLSTNTPAAFNWSSPSEVTNHWAQDNLGFQPMSSPIAQTHTAFNKPLHSRGHSRLVDPTPQGLPEATKQQTSKPLTETPTVANLVSPPPISSAPITSPDPWANPSSLDNSTAVEEKQVIAPVDDDDDWGEMVSSPTVSTPTATETASQMTTQSNILSTPPSTRSSVKAAQAQEISPDTMHASSIVRLQGMISPTSAIFGAKSFVPKGIEQGPIGPGILKPVRRVDTSMSEINKSEVQSFPGTKGIAKVAEEEASLVDRSSEAHATKDNTPESATGRHDDDDFAAFTSSTAPEAARPFTPSPSPAPPVQASTDSWADADFSFFESALPTAAPAPSQAKHDASDPFSVFETPQRSTSAASSAKTFTRSPPRNLTPPPLQPLTGATNSAQQRKAEEEDMIRSILNGLPDLSYMLR